MLRLGTPDLEDVRMFVVREGWSPSSFDNVLLFFGYDFLC